MSSPFRRLLMILTVITACGGPDEPFRHADDFGRSDEFSAAGWIEHSDSPIRPWCHTVLLTRDLAVTAASCVADTHPEQLELAWSPSAAAPEDENPIRTHVTAMLALDHGLAALRLGEAVDVEPASLGVPSANDCTLQVPHYRPTFAAAVPERAVTPACWVGTDRVRLNRPTSGHGVHGGAIYDDEGLLGAVTLGRAGGATYTVVTATSIDHAFARARDWAHND